MQKHSKQCNVAKANHGVAVGELDTHLDGVNALASPFFRTGCPIEIISTGVVHAGERGIVCGQGSSTSTVLVELDGGTLIAVHPLQLLAVPVVGQLVEASSASKLARQRGVVVDINAAQPRPILVAFPPTGDGSGRHRSPTPMRLQNLIVSQGHVVPPRCSTPGAAVDGSGGSADVDSGDSTESGPPPGPAAEKLLLLHISDTHRMLSTAVIDALPAADVLFHTGDFTNHGSAGEFAEFDAALKYMEDIGKFPVRVVILGNHELKQRAKEAAAAVSAVSDFSAGSKPHREFLRPLTDQMTHATCVPVCDEVVIPPGLRIHGSSWWCGHKGISKAGAAPHSVPGTPDFSTISPYTDVLLTHMPPWGILDHAGGAAVKEGQSDVPYGGLRQDTVSHWGSLPELRQAIDIKRPGLHLFGHVHESSGVVQHGSTLCVNGSTANWPKEPSASQRKADKKRVMNRLPFPARLIEASRSRPCERWSFQLVDEINVEEESIAGWQHGKPAVPP